MTIDEDDVIHQLYSAAAGLLPWPIALATLGRAMDALVCQFLTVERATGHLVVCEQPAETVVDAALDYIREYHRVDPHAAHIGGMSVGALLNTELTFPRDSMRSHRFYRDFWQPYAIRGLLGCKVGDDLQEFSIVSVVRSLDQPSFDAAEERRAGRFFRHLTNAVAISRHVGRLRVAGNVGMRLMEASSRPMFLMSAGRRLLSVNAAGLAFFANGSVLKEAGGRLVGTSDRTSRSLEDAFDRLWIDGAAGSRSALRLRADDGGTTLCLLWNLTPADSMGAFGNEKSVLLSIADSRVSGPIDAIFVAAMLDLSPAEARVASLLAFGTSPPDIATELHVSLHTVRTQIKAVFAKTGCQRQVQLSNMVNDLRH